MFAPLALRRAIRIWRSGEPIPVDLETDLMALGFDVRVLEDRYFIR